MKTRDIDTKKWTLGYIWYERVWCAYDTHLLLNPNPTNRIAYTSQSQFFISIPQVFIFILSYYLYALSWDRVGFFLFPVPIMFIDYDSLAVFD